MSASGPASNSSEKLPQLPEDDQYVRKTLKELATRDFDDQEKRRRKIMRAAAKTSGVVVDEASGGAVEGAQKAAKLADEAADLTSWDPFTRTTKTVGKILGKGLAKGANERSVNSTDTAHSAHARMARLRSDLRKEVEGRSAIFAANSTRSKDMAGRLARGEDPLARLRSRNFADNEITNAVALREQLFELALHGEGGVGAMAEHADDLLDMSASEILLLASYERERHGMPRAWNEDTGRLAWNEMGANKQMHRLSGAQDMRELAMDADADTDALQAQLDNVTAMIEANGLREALQEELAPLQERRELYTERITQARQPLVDDLTALVRSQQMSTQRGDRIADQLNSLLNRPTEDNLQKLREMLSGPNDKQLRAHLEQAVSRGKLMQMAGGRWHLDNEIQDVYSREAGGDLQEESYLQEQVELSRGRAQIYDDTAGMIETEAQARGMSETALLAQLAKVSSESLPDVQDSPELAQRLAAIDKAGLVKRDYDHFHGNYAMRAPDGLAELDKETLSVSLESLVERGLVESVSEQADPGAPADYRLTKAGRQFANDTRLEAINPKDVAAWSLDKGLIGRGDMVKTEELFREVHFANYPTAQKGEDPEVGKVRESWNLAHSEPKVLRSVRNGQNAPGVSEREAADQALAQLLAQTRPQLVDPTEQSLQDLGLAQPAPSPDKPIQQGI